MVTWYYVFMIENVLKCQIYHASQLIVFNISVMMYDVVKV
jgi:hypothetical protein